MAEWVNFAEVRRAVSLEAVLFTYYAVSGLKRSGSKLTGPCPVHGGDNPRAFHADLEKNVWHCFTGCQKGGNQLDFVAVKENISIRDAALRLQAHFLGGGNTPTGEGGREPRAPGSNGSAARERVATERPEPDAPSNVPIDVQLQLAPDHPHLAHDRRIKEETARTFGVGYCSRGIMRGTVAIPIHDDEGNLIAYAGRRLKPQDIREYGKYKLPKGFRKELVLYNFHRAKEQLDQGLVLVEGFFAVMALHQAGIPNVVAAMGCEVSEHQARLLSLAPSVTLLFDGDDAGARGTAAAETLLAGRTITRIVRLPDGAKPDSYDGKFLRWLIRGMASLDLAELSFRRYPLPNGESGTP